jgi:lipopolysaccharide export system permease protein
MPVFDRYLLKNLLIATALTTVVLTVVIFLTQSLGFLELVINAGASGAVYWELTILALPRFLEIILPIALMVATIFIYNRMTMDSELTVMRALGASPLRLARPALQLAAATAFFLWIVMAWLSPWSLAHMQAMRQMLEAQYSTLLFEPGVFTPIRPGLTVFVRDRGDNGELMGLMIHDGRDKNHPPATIIAKRGILAASGDGQQVLVYDGSRQTIDPATNTLNRLNFDRYIIELPDSSGPVHDRWREPTERTLGELLNPDMKDQRDVDGLRSFGIELQRRIVTPLLAPAYAIMALACLLLGPVDRRGQNGRIAATLASAVMLQGCFIAAANMTRHSFWGVALMYVIVLLPIAGGLILLMERSEGLRRRIHNAWRGWRKAGRTRTRAGAAR